MPNGGPRCGLLGRGRECEALDRLLEGVRAGRSAVLVLRGEPGVGNTALLEYVRRRATGCAIARVGGVESEMELAFAGLHQLCAPMLERLEGLPGPQREALQVALGLSTGGAPDRFLVGLAVLTLLSEATTERPLVCLVDDAQWLDRASLQALAFAARRLLAEPVAVVFAVQEPSEDVELRGLPELVVEGLGDADARLLLASAVHGPLDERVRERIVAEARGNPLALLELPGQLSSAELAGGFALPCGAPVAGRVEQSFVRRLESVPPAARRLLLVAAADPSGDGALLWQAAGRLGITADAGAAAEETGLIEFGSRVRFRHPLVRSAAYWAAPPHERRAVHRALAEATDPGGDPERRTWHRALAALGPDEAVADELERSAGRAQARGGVAAAAAFLERATRLTPDPARRGTRALAAAQAKLDAGAPDMASELLATAQLGLSATARAGPYEELQGARTDLLRARIAFAVNRGRDAPPLLLSAARRLAPLDPVLARETFLDVLEAAIFAGHLGGGVLQAAHAVGAAPPAPGPPRPVDLLLDGLVTRFTHGYAAGVAPLRRALEALLLEDAHGEDDLCRLWLAGCVAMELWDEEAWHELGTRAVRLARDTGALTVLPRVASFLAVLHVHAGGFGAASELLAEAEAVTRMTGNAPLGYTQPVLAAWRGREAEAVPLIEAVVGDATARGDGRAINIADYATALLDNSLGRYDAALAVARRGSAHDDLVLSNWVLPELIEAGTRSGRPDLAGDALRQLGERTRACGTEWALGTEACFRALLSEGPVADALYREATDRLSRTRGAVHLARAHLLHGEWLRRENRRLDARVQLRRAHEMFEDIGAEAFAERTRRELVATGETVRKPAAQPLDALTAQEAQIARLAREGQTNPEIGARLFLSPRTVEWHLRKVFTKLGIGSRRELRQALRDPAWTATPV
jgi:DNA-binding CsgD family transcriptional regulator